MIFCVIPLELEADLYDKMVSHYAGNARVTVILDRRGGPDRRRRRVSAAIAEQRETRDRRRARVPGTFARTDVPDP